MISGVLRRKKWSMVTNVSMRLNKDFTLSIIFNNMKVIGNLDESSYRALEEVEPHYNG